LQQSSQYYTCIGILTAHDQELPKTSRWVLTTVGTLSLIVLIITHIRIAVFKHRSSTQGPILQNSVSAENFPD
jgi:hypothetical protein